MEQPHIRGPLALRTMCTLAVLVVVGACGPTVSGDSEQTSPPMVEFDPGAKIIPTPNNMVLEDGRVNIPRQCGEVKLARDVRVDALNGLDGFGNYKPALGVTFTHKVDEDSLLGRVLFTCRSPVETALLSCEPHSDDCDLTVDTTTRIDPKDCMGRRRVYQMIATPQHPLGERTTCVVAILDGVLTADGVPFGPSPTWYLTRQAESPVEIVGDEVLRNQTPIDSADVETLREFQQDVWEPHQALLAMLENRGYPRSSILLAWEFTTQTLFDPLDQTQPGSPAFIATSASRDVELIEVIQRAGPARNDDPIGNMFEEELVTVFKSGGDRATVTHPCDYVPCENIGTIVVGRYTSPRFLRERDNPGDLPDPATDQWDDAYHPTPFRINEWVEFRAWFPDPVRVPQPPCGYPVVILGPGLTGAKDNWYPTAPYLAAAGLAAISIDPVNQGGRAVRISDEGERCGDIGPYVSDEAVCYEHIIPLKLATGRDNVRQTVIDTLNLARLVASDGIRQACIGPRCDELRLDSQRIGYEGVSMGAVIGTIIGAMTPEIKASVLTAGGAGWIDLFLSGAGDIRCPMVDGLIKAGILEGKLWGTEKDRDALCTESTWEDDLKFRAIADAARWILGPADPANFGLRLGDRIRASGIRVLVQQMHAEALVANSLTEELASIIGFNGWQSSGWTESPQQPRPSALICDATATGGSLFLDYSASGDPENHYVHQSVHMLPTNNDVLGRGAVQVMHDVATFLCESLERVPGEAPACTYVCNDYLSGSAACPN